MRFIPWGIALILCLFHLSVVIGYTGILSYASSGLNSSVSVAVVYWLIVLACGFTLIRGIIKSTIRKTSKFTLYNVAVSIVMIAGIIWLLIDEKPMTDDYTEADIRSQSNGSYQHLNVFNQSKPEDVEQIGKLLKESGQIESAWLKVAKYRQAIDALNQFDNICDLPPDKPLDINTPFLRYQTLRPVAEIYHNYFKYKVEQGEGALVVEDVSRFNTFTRKGMSDATIIINKMIFAAMAEKSINTAYDVIGKKQCDMETIKILQRDFTPLNSDEYGFRKVLIGEYLFLKNTMQQQMKPNTFFDIVEMGATDGTTRSPRFPLASQIGYYVGFKPNMSLRDIKQRFDLIVAAQNSNPPDYAAVYQYAESYNRRPQLRNMAGWILNSIAYPNFEKYSQKGVKLKIKSDLLAIAIHKKTGAPLEIKDYYTGGPYRYKEENGVMRHPGPDGRYGTEDDITLGVLPSENGTGKK